MPRGPVKQVIGKSVVHLDSCNRPKYSETCLIQLALTEKFCVGIDKVSDYTVQKINRKIVDRKINVGNHMETDYTSVGLDRVLLYIGSCILCSSCAFVHVLSFYSLVFRHFSICYLVFPYVRFGVL